MADLRTNYMNQLFFNEYFKKIHQTVSSRTDLWIVWSGYWMSSYLDSLIEPRIVYQLGLCPI